MVLAGYSKEMITPERGAIGLKEERKNINKNP